MVLLNGKTLVRGNEGFTAQCREPLVSAGLMGACFFDGVDMKLA